MDRVIQNQLSTEISLDPANEELLDLARKYCARKGAEDCLDVLGLVA